MKLLMLCNMKPAVVQEKLTGTKQGGLWVDHVLSALREQENLTIHVLCPGEGEGAALDEGFSFSLFPLGQAHVYQRGLEERFGKTLADFAPDVIHIWGTEYGHTLAMVNAAEKNGLLDRVVIHIQGLCSIYAGHYAEGVPRSVQNGYTFRDLLRRDNIRAQQEKFVLRGEMEVAALKKVRHVIGRTDWDEACTCQINPEARYHFGNETLREQFFEGAWDYSKCRKHRIFAPSCAYPVKGFHYLLEAFAEVVKNYPDATLAVTGKSYFSVDPKRRGSYQKYLAERTRELGLADKIEFLGGLSAEGMKENYLAANAFVLPSTIENSPNSLGEAMLLGVPCVASHVGGVTTMMTHGKEGYIYQSTAPYMLAHYICKVFAMEDAAAELGRAAAAHARITHDPRKNLCDLLEIYREIVGE